MKLPEPRKISLQASVHRVEKTKDEVKTLTASVKNLDILKQEDIKDNDGFLYFQADLANLHEINKNGNGITIQDGINIYQKWEHTFMDVEHITKDVRGFIVKSVLTNKETGEILSKEDALKSDKPINISVGFLIWKKLDQNLSHVLSEIGKSKDDDLNGLISLSLELSYDEFCIYEGDSSNMFEGKMILEDNEVDEIYSNLKEFGGDGISPKTKKPIFLVASGDSLCPSGAGLVTFPAGDLKGIQSVEKIHKEDCDCDKCLLSKEQKNSTELINKLKELDEKIDKSVKEFKNSLDILNKNNLKGSQLNNNVVKKVNMKITKCSDITDALLESKEIVASDVARFISDEIAKNSEIAAENLKAKENEAKEAQIVADAAKVKVDELNLSLEATNKRLEEIEQKASADKVENDFQLRMNSLASEYELTEEDSEVVASQVRGLSDEDYEKWNKSFSILAKEKNKEFIKIKKEKDKGKDKDKEKDKSMEASVVTDEIIEDPLDALKKKAETMVSTASFSEDVLAGYRDAFSLTKGVTVEI